MCCCGKPTINGEMGYRWQPNDKPSIWKPNPPALMENDVLLCDEPGRCGGLDCHCFHYRLVRRWSTIYLLVRHGGRDECFRISHTPELLATLAALDSNARYWFLHALYHAHESAGREASAAMAERYRKAFVAGKLKKRKLRGRDAYRVEITD